MALEAGRQGKMKQGGEWEGRKEDPAVKSFLVMDSRPWHRKTAVVCWAGDGMLARLWNMDDAEDPMLEKALEVGISRGLGAIE